MRNTKWLEMSYSKFDTPRTLGERMKYENGYSYDVTLSMPNVWEFVEDDYSEEANA